jgi:hypothetical protein
MKNIFRISILLLSLSLSSNSLSSPKDDIKNTINVLETEYRFGNAKTDILEYSNSRWRYYYQIFDNYAIFKMLEIYDGNEVELSTMIIREGFTLLIDMTSRTVVYQSPVNGIGGGSEGMIDESGSSMQSSKKIPFDKEVTGYFNSKNIGDSIYDYDSYVFSLKENGKISIDFSKSKSSSYIYIETSSRKMILDKHYMQGDKITLDIDLGYYQLVLRSQGHIGGSGKDFPYKIKISCTNRFNSKCKTLEDDYPNEFSNATLIKESEKLTGKINYENDIDFFKFYIPKNDIYDFSVKGKGVVLGLYKKSHTSLNAGCRASAQGSFCRTPLSKGNYYITFQSNQTRKSLPNYEMSFNCAFCTEKETNITEKLQFPVDGDGWTVTLGSKLHKKYTHKNDTFALDLNLNVKKYDDDKGKKVYPILPGTIYTHSSSLGALVIKHNAEKYNYSLYMHMKDIPEELQIIGAIVDKTTKLGIISNVGANNNHLHFAVYKTDKRHAIDIANVFPIEFLDNIELWIDNCSTSIITHKNPWWKLGDKPCKNIGIIDFDEK